MVLISSTFLRATAYVDQILRRTRTGDLPVQAPTAFEMVGNAKTARVLDLFLPASSPALTRSLSRVAATGLEPVTLSFEG
jgi:ABC-type uncharacterized transport system substrate-binding protein